MTQVATDRDASSAAGGIDQQNDPIRGVLWTTQRHGGRDASLSMVDVQSEPNWMLDGAGSEFDEDAAERPMTGAPSPAPAVGTTTNKASTAAPAGGGGALASLFGSKNTLSRTRRAPRRTISTDSAVSLESVESFWSYGSNDHNSNFHNSYNINSHNKDGDRDDDNDNEAPIPHSISTAHASSSNNKNGSDQDGSTPPPPVVAAGSPTGRRGGKRRDFQLRVLGAQGATLVTSRDVDGNATGVEKEESPEDDDNTNHDKVKGDPKSADVDDVGAPILRRIFRTFSWDGYDPNRGAGSATANSAAVAAVPPPPSATATLNTSDHENQRQAWKDEKERMTGDMEALRKQVMELQSLVVKFERNPQLVITLEQQLKSAADEHVQVSELVKDLQKQIQSKDQELTVLRLESLNRGGFGTTSAAPSANDNEGSGASSAGETGGADSIGLCTSSRWDSPEVRGGSAVMASTLVVSADEYKALQSARDTSMMRAGELAHQLALARGDVDDLQERMHLTNERLQTTILESVELKATNDALQAKVEWLEQQLQQFQSDGRRSLGSTSSSFSSSSVHGVPRTPSSRLGQLLQRSPAKSSPFQRLQTTLTTTPSSPSPSATAVSPSSTINSGSPDTTFSTVSVDGPDESTSAENEVLARELFKLKQQVSQLQDEKAECLATLVEAQAQLTQRHSHESLT